MPKMRGTIRKNDVEGGVYQFHADNGDVFEVDGSDPLLHSEGASVEIDGSVDKNAVSFTMTGPRLKVKSVRRI